MNIKNMWIDNQDLCNNIPTCLNTGGAPEIYACGDKEKSCGSDVCFASSSHLSFEAGIFSYCREAAGSLGRPVVHF